MFDVLSKGFKAARLKLQGKTELNEANLAEALREVRTSLIQAGGGVSAPADPEDPRLREDTFFGLHLFAGAEGRAVARNIFLDGNSFRDSRHVDKLPFVGDIQYGVAMTIGDWRVAYTQVAALREFKGQKNGDSFGSFSISTRF